MVFLKNVNCLRNDSEVLNATYSWGECADYIQAVLCGLANSDLSGLPEDKKSIYNVMRDLLKIKNNII